MLPKALVEEMLAEALRSVPAVEAAAIYGSWAKGELHDDSDIDILILAGSTIRWARVRECLDELEPVIGRPLGIAGYPLSHFWGRGISPYGFLSRILSGPLVPLIGDARALRPSHRSKDYVPRVARDRGIKYGHHRGVNYGPK
jgi:predicted nucleotidyltransferase